jgi:tripartite-type tricarboxylate transporter receptor subunit TctC
MRRACRQLLAAVLCAYPVAACAQASAQSFPSRPIRIVIGFSAGSNSDSLARPMARRLAETIGQQIIDRLNNMIGKVLTLPDVREFYATQNVEVLLMTPAEFSAKVRADHDKWGKIIREAGLKTAN